MKPSWVLSEDDKSKLAGLVKPPTNNPEDVVVKTVRDRDRDIYGDPNNIKG